MMKKILISCFPVLLFTMALLPASAQTGNPMVPYQPNPSPLFGQDITLCNLPHQDQRTLAICSAPNGWMYSVFSFDSLGYKWAAFLRSKDNGATWETLSKRMYWFTYYTMKKLNLISTGSTSTDHKLIFADVVYDAYLNSTLFSLLKFNCDPFQMDEGFAIYPSLPHHDIAIAGDFDHPAQGSNPCSIGVLYSKTGIKDSIIFLSSGECGINLTNRQVLAITNKKFHKVSLAYGYSPTQNTGRYFAAWEEKSDTNSTLGSIYTSHSNPGFNSPFTPAVKLDALDPTIQGRCRNPVIACQVSPADNDSGNISEVILFEKRDQGSSDFDIVGYFNKKGTANTGFSRMNIAETTNNELQPDLAFNPYDSTFVMTYYDSTTQSLALWKKHMNLHDPDNWDVINSQYNDNNNLICPQPLVSLNPLLKMPYCGWLAERPDAHGTALFDALYIPVGLHEKGNAHHAVVKVFPNPCRDKITLDITLDDQKEVRIILTTLDGRLLRTFKEGLMTRGSYILNYPIEIQAGMYILSLTAGEMSLAQKLCVVK